MNGTSEKHDHKDCRKLLGSLSEYVDGELSDELCNVIEQHMEDCENCRIVVDTLKKTVYLYHEAAETEDIPGEMRERLFKSLNIDKYIE